MKPARVVAFVMAGGEGARLRPFTEMCAKPALPFGGAYRIIDFVLSSLYHSRVARAHVLVHYRPLLLARHLADSWSGLRTASGQFVRVLPPEAAGVAAFRGTADAVAAAVRTVDLAEDDLIAVFAADHVYRMDVRQMAAFHRERNADVTVAAAPVPAAKASAFGIICAERDGRVVGFQEKPARPDAIPGDPERAYASMGNYLFRLPVLRGALAEAQAGGEHDFGRHVLPRLVGHGRVFAYDFAGNVVPGVAPAEEPAYWRDVGAIDAYIEAHRDLLGPEPRFRLDNVEWPILCGGTARLLRPLSGGDVEDSIIGPGVRFYGAALRRSVLQRGACVESGAELEDCIVMEDAHVGHGVRLQDALVGSGSLLRVADVAQRRNPRRAAWSRSPAGVLIVPPRCASRSTAAA